jgi:hypothetical protein
MALKEVKYTVNIIESELDEPCRLVETQEFDTEAERDEYIKKFNANNTEPIAPDWYMMAEKGRDKITDPCPNQA